MMYLGEEFFGKFLFDGQWVVFIGQVDGDEQVYVVFVVGGVLKQLIYYFVNGFLLLCWGYDNQVYGWYFDGSVVFFCLMCDGWDLGDMQFFFVDVDGGLLILLLMFEFGGGFFFLDGMCIVYLLVMCDFWYWKCYEGGWV